MGYDKLAPMNLSIRQIHPVFVGEVSGIDITTPLSREEVAAIEAGMDRYAVLVFHDQKITNPAMTTRSRATCDAPRSRATPRRPRRLSAP